MPWVEVGGADVHYLDEGSGPPLVLLHGFGSCAEAWYQQVEAFADRYRVLAYDSVNHGHSSNSPRGEPEPDRADELEGFLAALGVERPVIAGNSMGALTLLRWASRHPAEAAALVPSAMGVVDDLTGDPARRRRMFDPIDADTIFLPVADSFTEEFRRERPRMLDRYTRARSTATRIEASRHPRPFTSANPSREELAGAVGRIESPMLIVVGTRDWLHGAALRLHELVAHSRLVEIDGAPHNAYFEVASAYNDAVAEFLTAVAPSTARSRAG